MIRKCMKLLICILAYTMMLSGCGNKKEKLEDTTSQSEDILYDYEIKEQEDIPNVDIVPSE